MYVPCYPLAHNLCLTIVHLGGIAGDYGVDTRETTKR